VRRYPVLRSIVFVDDRHGWAVGEAGHALRTEDGGSTWQDIRVGHDAALLSVYFVDENRGWAGAWLAKEKRAAIFYTENGGEAWQIRKRFEKSDILSIWALHFADQEHGWAFGNVDDVDSGGVILETDDGGDNWTKQYSGDAKNGFIAVDFINGKEAWTIGDNEILHTENGGIQWNVQYHKQGHEPDSTFWGLDFSSLSDGLVIRSEPNEVLRTRDGGVTWSPEVIPSQATILGKGKDMYCYAAKLDGPSRVIAGCSDGIILLSSDRGEHWVVEKTGVPGALLSLAITSRAEFATGTRGAILRRMK
jgi:photosystem II stability/assembly factor-like uncharacterized protein